MTQIEKLTELIEVVKGIPNENFNMENWRCGSVGCAGGAAAMHPPFQKLGLHLVESILLNENLSETLYYHPVYKKRIKDQALEKFFDLSPNECSFIFMPDCYGNRDDDYALCGDGEITKEKVIEHIRIIIEKVKDETND